MGARKVKVLVDLPEDTLAAHLSEYEDVEEVIPLYTKNGTPKWGLYIPDETTEKDFKESQIL